MNAGFISLDRQETKEGVERQFGINHLGHFLLTTQLLDMMVPGSQIVNVADGARTAIYLVTADAVANKTGGYFYMFVNDKSDSESLRFEWKLEEDDKDLYFVTETCGRIDPARFDPVH